MHKNIKNQNGGFIQFVLLIVIVLIIMKMGGVTFSSLIAWFKSLLLSTL